MTDPDFLGLRREDLTDAERTLLEQDPQLRAQHEEELALGARLQSHSDPVPARRPKRVSAWLRVPLVAAGVAIAAALPLTVGGPDSTLTPRGMGFTPLEVQLEAVETTQRRALHSGARLQAGQAVAFRVLASRPGTVRILEDANTVVYPPSGSWQVEAGPHWLGGEASPLQWTTDAGPGSHRYRVELCVEVGDCVTDELELVWLSEP